MYGSRHGNGNNSAGATIICIGDHASFAKKAKADSCLHSVYVFTTMVAASPISMNGRSQGAKKRSSENLDRQQPPKKIRVLLPEDDQSNTEQDTYGNSKGVSPDGSDPSFGDHGFTINEDFSRRFEHNKKREELQKRKSRSPLPISNLY